MGGHRKFLKTRNHHIFVPGKYFPKKMRLKSGGEILNLFRLSASDNGTLVFVMSEYCSACSIEPIITMVQSHPEFNYYLLYESDEDLLHVHSSMEVLQADIREIEHQLNYGAIVPWVFALNQVGQIIGGGVFNTYNDVQYISRGLINVYEDKVKGVFVT